MSSPQERLWARVSPEQREALVHSLRRYCTEKLDRELMAMEAGFFLEYLFSELGPFPYNMGVEDAQRYFLARSEEMPSVCFEEGLTWWKGEKAGAVRRKRS